MQELIIPLIKSSRKREKVVSKVTPQLISNQNLRVVSNVLQFNLLQKEPVSRNEKEITLSIGLYDDLKLVSNEEIKLMNFTSDSPSERMLQVKLILATERINTALPKVDVEWSISGMNASSTYSWEIRTLGDITSSSVSSEGTTFVGAGT